MNSSQKTALIVGASRGLGLAIAQEYLKRGWNVIATERSSTKSGLHAIKDEKLRVETLDINKQDQIRAIAKKLGGQKLDLLFVNAGVANGANDRLEEATDEDFNRVMMTNALSPMRVISALDSLVQAGGTIAAMSSGLGSVAGNDSGAWEVYRASKAALNMFMRSYAARKPDDKRTYLALCPGWVRTEMGGSEAPLSIEESIPRLVDVVIKQAGHGGSQYLEYTGETVAW